MVFAPALLRALDDDPNPMVLLDREGVIRHLNRAWVESVAENPDLGIPPPRKLIGEKYLDLVSGPTRSHLAEAFARTGQLERGPRSIWLHAECNTPQFFRRLTTRIAPLWDEKPTPSGYLVQSLVRIVGPLGERYRLEEPHVSDWRQKNGFLVQCGCCRRVRDPKTREWHMCVELLEHPALETTHGVCELCLETYYGEPLVSEEAPPEPALG